MDLNKVMLIGRLGRDPETRYTQSGTAVTNINVATSEKWKDKNSGEQQERTEWHRIVAFGRTAEIMSVCLRKGSQVFIQGKLQTRKWEDKDGNDRYTTEILVDNYGGLIMLGDGKGGGKGGGGSRQRDEGSDDAEDDEPRGKSSQADAFDDDIPF